MRRGPWICNRDTYGTIYFINLRTNVTQWLRPLGWMQHWGSRDAGYRNEFSFGPKSYFKLSPNDARQMVEGGAPTDYNVGQPSYPRDETDDKSTYPSDSPKKLDYLTRVLEDLDDASLTNWWTRASTIQDLKASILRQGGFTSGALGTWEILIKAFMSLWNLNRINTVERLCGHMSAYGQA